MFTILFLYKLLSINFDREDIPNTQELKEFYDVSKHLEARQKCSAPRRMFSSLFFVWNVVIHGLWFLIYQKHLLNLLMIRQKSQLILQLTEMNPLQFARLTWVY